MGFVLVSPMASSDTNLLLLITAVILLISASDVQTQKSIAVDCITNAGNYTANSTYLANLNRLTAYLATNGSATGYADGIVGSVPDRVYGLVLCRGDVNSSKCKVCLSNAGQDILDQCPLNKAATIWYDNCLLRYSDTRFTAAIDNGIKWYLWNVNNVTSEWPRFNQSLWYMMDTLTKYAAYNTSATPPLLFATGDMGFNSIYPKIYGLVQCTRDLSADDCNKCLKAILGELPNCCNQRIGGRVLAASCNFRYEVGPFYDGTSRISLPSLTATSPASAPMPPLAPRLHAPPTVLKNSTNSTIQGAGNKKNSTGITLAIVIPVGLVLILFIFCCTCCLRREAMKKHPENADDQEIPSSESLLFSLDTLKNATENFSESNKLGEGGFGAVYRGKQADGKEMAVKRLSKSSSQGIDELKNEVVLLAKLQHRNLVRLLGVCIEEEEKLLIYEYVQNKSLDKFLFDPTKKEQLDWRKRYKIIEGIARGLLYLHEESQVRIIHRDLKASNILLDADMNPKISDFGLARLFDGEQTQANTMRVVGTYGYMSPEYALRGQFSSKSDVFSFGVLVLEIVTGQKTTDFFLSESSSDLLGYVWEHWSKGTATEIIDPYLGEMFSKNEALRCIQVGLLCVQESTIDRPSMSTVVIMLSGYSVSVNIPSRPALLGRYSREKESFQGTTDKSILESMPHTPNEVSITEPYPR